MPVAQVIEQVGRPVSREDACGLRAALDAEQRARWQDCRVVVPVELDAPGRAMLCLGQYRQRECQDEHYRC